MASNYALLVFLGVVVLNGTVSFVNIGVNVHTGLRLRGSESLGAVSHIQANPDHIQTNAVTHAILTNESDVMFDSTIRLGGIGSDRSVPFK
jgi:hypothetical protein